MRAIIKILLGFLLFYSSLSWAWMPIGTFWDKSLHLLAGGIGGRGMTNGSLSSALLYDPQTLTFDLLGNIYFVDSDIIRKITPGRIVSTLAGRFQGSADGTGSAARFHSPSGIVTDSLGNIFVADRWNHVIRKITPAGVVTTFATGFSYPTGLAIDASDNLYVANKDAQTINKITTAGIVSTLAGSQGHAGSTDGTGIAARFNYPFSLTLDASENIYVTDSQNHTIRKITPAGIVTTIAGSAGTSGTSDGTGSSARFNIPLFIILDSNGDLLVSDYINNSIRKVTIAGVVTTFAGISGTSGNSDGTGSAARFSLPSGLAKDATGNVYVADSSNYLIRKITPAGIVTTFAGKQAYGSNDGTGISAMFYSPSAIAVNAAGEFYVADTSNHTIRKITSSGVVTTIAGTAGIFGNIDATGSAARFHSPSGITIDSSGNVFVTDNGNHTIRKITTGGVVTTIAGNGSSGSSDGTGSSAQFKAPGDITIDATDNIYIADTGNHTIRMMTPAGVVTTIAGSAGSVGSTNATGSAARFFSPTGITIDSSGMIFVAEYNNHTIRQITPGGVVTTIAGMAGVSGNINANGSAARFNHPNKLTLDSLGNLFVSDNGNHIVRKISPTKDVTKIVGSTSFYNTIYLGPLPGGLNFSNGGALVIKNSKLFITSDSSILWCPKP